MVTYSDTFSGSGALGVTQVGGQAWQVLSGSWSRSGGFAVTSTAKASNPLAVVNVNTGDADVSLNVSQFGGDALYFRVQDASNWWRLLIDYYTTSSTSSGYWTPTAWTLQSTSCVNGYGGPNDSYSGQLPNEPDQPSTWVHTDARGTCDLGGTGQAEGWEKYYVYERSETYVSGSTTTTPHYTVYLQKCVAGSVMTVQTYSTAATALRVVAAGGSITPYLNGVSKTPVTDSTLSTATRFGVGRGSVNSGDTSAIDNFSITPANIPPNAPSITAPLTGVPVNYQSTVPVSWKFSDTDAGATQSLADVQWWDTDSSQNRVGAVHTVLGAVTTTTTWNAPAGTFAPGGKELQVRTYDNNGVVGPWSPSRFFNASNVQVYSGGALVPANRYVYNNGVARLSFPKTY